MVLSGFCDNCDFRVDMNNRKDISFSFKRMQCLSQIFRQTTVKMATIMDLDEKCLADIFQHLSKFDLFALRQTNSRFIGPTEICYKRNFADDEFNTSEWITFEYYNESATRACKHLEPTIKEVIQYFGQSMKNVLVDDNFVGLFKNESISESLLPEYMANVERITIREDIDKNTLDYFAPWKETKELFLEISFLHYVDTVRADAVADDETGDNSVYVSSVIWDRSWPNHVNIKLNDLVAFLKTKTNLRKLHVVDRAPNAEDEQILIGVIAQHMPNLVDLNIGDFPLKKLSLICGLSNLESLVIRINDDVVVEPFRGLTKLKYLEISNECPLTQILQNDHVSMQNLLDLVEFVPSLRRISLKTPMYSIRFTRADVDRLVARRMLSPNCETEKLELLGNLPGFHYLYHKNLIKNLESKYVSCEYIDCDNESLLEETSNDEYDED